LTPRGRRALGAHVAALQALIDGLDPAALQADAPSGPRT
jgi:hypothetical protein